MGIKVKIQLTSLFFINENFTNKYNIEALDILSIFIIICGIYIIISKNPIVSILFLIGLFGGISSYLILTGLSFIGLSYLIIYLGAVSILFLFILMLINIRISELQNNNKNSVTLALIILIFVNYSIFPIFPYTTGVSNNYYRNINYMLYKVSSDQDNINTSGKNNDLYFASSNDWSSNIIDVNNITNIGNIMYTSNNLWLIITAFILILAMVGTIVITIKNNQKEISSMVEQPFYTR